MNFLKQNDCDSLDYEHSVSFFSLESGKIRIFERNVLYSYFGEK